MLASAIIRCMEKLKPITLRVKASTHKAIVEHCKKNGLKIQFFANAAMLKAIEASK